MRPWIVEGLGDKDQVTAHTLRHSVYYRMVVAEGKTTEDVKNRLRHRSIQTTERVYQHIDVV